MGLRVKKKVLIYMSINDTMPYKMTLGNKSAIIILQVFISLYKMEKHKYDIYSISELRGYDNILYKLAIIIFHI